MKKTVAVLFLSLSAVACGLIDNQSTPKGYVRHCVRLLDRQALYADKPEWKEKRKEVLVSAKAITSLDEAHSLVEEAAAVLAAHALGIIQGRRPAGIVLQQAAELLPELLALDDRQVGLAQFIDALVEDLGDVGSPKLSVESVFINLVTHISRFTFRHKKSLSRSRQALSCNLISLHGCSAHEF